MSFNSSCLFLAFLVLLALFCVADARSMTGSSTAIEFEWFVFPKGCLPKFLAGDIFDPFCLKKSISKVLGYGIIAGACVVKVPQIYNFVRAGSVDGLSPASAYLELLGYLLVSIFHIVLVRSVTAVFSQHSADGQRVAQLGLALAVCCVVTDVRLLHVVATLTTSCALRRCLCRKTHGLPTANL